VPGFDITSPIDDAFVDVLDMAECLVLNARMPDRIVCAIGCVSTARAFTDAGQVPVKY
jgi:hypothetical protein